jgi:prepilin-type processing-associated H-X9-DG protein
VFTKQSAIKGPSPSLALTFIDESIQTIDDGIFFLKSGSVTSVKWDANAPTARHGKAAVMSFADGHSERWRWKSLSKDETSGAAGDVADITRLLEAVYLP